MLKTGYVYTMSSKSRTLYTGVTSNLERRVWKHKTHYQPGFSDRYRTDRLVYIAEFARMDDALAWNWYEDHLAAPDSASRGDPSLRSG